MDNLYNRNKVIYLSLQRGGFLNFGSLSNHRHGKYSDIYKKVIDKPDDDRLNHVIENQLSFNDTITDVIKLNITAYFPLYGLTENAFLSESLIIANRYMDIIYSNVIEDTSPTYYLLSDDMVFKLVDSDTIKKIEYMRNQNRIKTIMDNDIILESHISIRSKIRILLENLDKLNPISEIENSYISPALYSFLKLIYNHNSNEYTNIVPLIFTFVFINRFRILYDMAVTVTKPTENNYDIHVISERHKTNAPGFVQIIIDTFKKNDISDRKGKGEIVLKNSKYGIYNPIDRMQMNTMIKGYYSHKIADIIKVDLVAYLHAYNYFSILKNRPGKFEVKNIKRHPGIVYMELISNVCKLIMMCEDANKQMNKALQILRSDETPICAIILMDYYLEIISKKTNIMINKISQINMLFNYQDHRIEFDSSEEKIKLIDQWLFSRGLGSKSKFEQITDNTVHVDSYQYPNCGESTIMNILNYLLIKEDGGFKIIDTCMSDELILFYKKYPNMDTMIRQRYKVSNDFALLLSERSHMRYGIIYYKDKCEIAPNIENVIKILRKLFTIDFGEESFDISMLVRVFKMIYERCNDVYPLSISDPGNHAYKLRIKINKQTNEIIVDKKIIISFTSKHAAFDIKSQFEIDSGDNEINNMEYFCDSIEDAVNHEYNSLEKVIEYRQVNYLNDLLTIMKPSDPNNQKLIRLLKTLNKTNNYTPIMLLWYARKRDNDGDKSGEQMYEIFAKTIPDFDNTYYVTVFDDVIRNKLFIFTPAEMVRVAKYIEDFYNKYWNAYFDDIDNIDILSSLLEDDIVKINNMKMHVDDFDTRFWNKVWKSMLTGLSDEDYPLYFYGKKYFISLQTYITDFNKLYWPLTWEEIEMSSDVTMLRGLTKDDRYKMAEYVTNFDQKYWKALFYNLDFSKIRMLRSSNEFFSTDELDNIRINISDAEYWNTAWKTLQKTHLETIANIEPVERAQFKKHIENFDEIYGALLDEVHIK
jgi:hypothetical protein